MRYLRVRLFYATPCFIGINLSSGLAFVGGYLFTDTSILSN